MKHFARFTFAFLFALSMTVVAHAQNGAVQGDPKAPLIALERCGQPPVPPSAAQAAISVVINQSTRWQPRGGTIIVAVTDPQAALATTQLIACLGWKAPSSIAAPSSGPGGAGTPAPTISLSWTVAAVLVRPTDATDRPYTTNLGINVPDLADAPYTAEQRIIDEGYGDAFGIVPVAHLRLIALNGADVVFDSEQSVGITSHRLSYAVAIAAVALALVAVGCLSRTVPEPKARGRFGWILNVIKARDGTASLSSLQMLLWTILVIGCAAYVMSLSGTLINITDGTLMLLGIAGAARLVAAYTESTAPPPPVPIATPPQWSDILRADGTAAVDITRIQMLLFTLVSAWFVALVVLTTYVIPDIPSGYQVLMGLSNGVYVGRKLMP